jgi:hypothetical protein
MLQTRTRFVLAALAVLALTASSALADSGLSSLKEGTPELKSAGALAFGADGILFVGDPKGASIYALDTGDRTPATTTDKPKVEGIDSKMASLLGIEAGQLAVNDLAVNPISGNVYLSLSRGKGPDAQPAILKLDRSNKLSEFGLKSVKFARAELPNPAKGGEVITQIQYVKGNVYVAGLSSEQFASNLRAIPFPFKGVDKGTSVEIFHGAHGGIETKSPVRTFAAYDIQGETNILAAYTCTPLVRFPVKELKVGEKVRGTTVAELGNGNRPLDMIVYSKGGKDFILMCNSKHGLLKIPTEGIEKVEPITKKINGKAGLKAETIESYKTNVLQLDRFDKDHAVLLVKGDKGGLNIETIELP